MRKFLLMVLVVVLLASMASCGGAAEAPVATEAPTATSAPSAPAASGYSEAVLAYAAEHAGGPGAIYVGDLNQLVGLAATPDQGDFDGNVPLDALERHLFIFESDYY